MIRLTVNGRLQTVDVEPETPLLWVLRDTLGLTGTKYGCGVALCGACTVHVDGKVTRSCVTPVEAVAGRAVTTIEGLSRDGSHPVQRAWAALDVPRCGYCQCGQMMAAAALLASAAAGLALPGLLVRPVLATPESMRAAIREVAGDAPLAPDLVTLEVPPLAENGNAVPVTVRVASPMTPDAFVREIHLFTEQNPLPDVARFHLGPRAGRAEVTTRIRLSASQRVVALAALSDGTFHVAIAVTADGAARPFFEAGRRLYYRRQGQLDLACHHCHERHAGRLLRGERLSQGQATGYPI